MALLQKMTYKDKASCGSSPPYSEQTSEHLHVRMFTCAIQVSRALSRSRPTATLAAYSTLVFFWFFFLCLCNTSLSRSLSLKIKCHSYCIFVICLFLVFCFCAYLCNTSLSRSLSLKTNCHSCCKFCNLSCTCISQINDYILQHTLQQCTRQQAATHCNTLQHTAIYCNT